MKSVQSFLVNLIGVSEDLDAAADTPDPELADIEYDDHAMAEAAAESYEASVEMAEIDGEEFDEDELWRRRRSGPVAPANLRGLSSCAASLNPRFRLVSRVGNATTSAA